MNIGRYLRGEDLHVGTSRITKPKELKMNERIRELIVQATEVSEPLSGNCSPDAPDLDKLVELIVLECIDQCFTDDADRIARHFDIDISEE